MEKVIGEQETKLTPAQKAEFKLMETTFKEQLTQKGLDDLRARFPSNVIIDMTVDENFKQGRKDRTERNKLTEAINRRRIDVSTSIKEHGDNLIDQVNGIFSNAVGQFEKEDARRKQIEKEKKEKHERMLNEQREKIAGIDNFITEAKETDDTDVISGLVDCVNNICPEEFHKDLVHEVMEKIKKVSSELVEILTQKIESNRLKAEAEAAAEAEKAAKAATAEAKRVADEEAAEVERKSTIDKRLTKLQMMPLDMMEESADKIGRKLEALKNYDVPKEDFAERYDEAVKAKDEVIVKLQKLYAMAKMTEDSNKAEAEAAEPELQPDPEVQQEQLYQQEQEQEPQQRETRTPDEVLASMKTASDLLPENQTQEAAPATLSQDLNAWANHYSIHPSAFESLLDTLKIHGVNTL